MNPVSWFAKNTLSQSSLLAITMHAIALTTSGLFFCLILYFLGELPTNKPFLLISILIGILLTVQLFAWLAGKFSKRWHYRAGGFLALFRDKLLQGFACLTAISSLGYGSLLFQPLLERLLLDTPLETLLEPAIYLSGVSLGLGMAVLLYRLPQYLAVELTSARLPVHCAAVILRYWATWITMGVWEAVYSFVYGSDYNLAMMTLLCYAAGFGYSLSILGWMKITPKHHPLDAQVESAVNTSLWLVFFWPIQDKPHLKQIDHWARLYPHQTVTLAAPSGSKPLGEHLYYANLAGKLKALFPRHHIEIKDWLRAVPQGGICNATTCREIYPSLDLLPQTIQTLRTDNDYTVLGWEQGLDLEPWRGKLPLATTRVLVMEPAREMPAEIAGYTTLKADDSKTLQQWMAERPKPNKPKVFISYVSEYRFYAEQLADALSANCEVLSDMLLLPGDNWGEKLAAMLESAEAVIALVGRATDGRPLPLAEIERAIALSKRFIPVFIDPFEEPRVVWNYQAANPRRANEFLYLGEQSENELAKVIMTTADNILRSLNLKITPAKTAPEKIEKHQPTNSVLLTETVYNQRFVIAGVLLLGIVAGGYYFKTVMSCNADDPPFECKFNQKE